MTRPPRAIAAAAATVALVVAASVAARADVVHLKDGRVLRGEVSKKGKATIVTNPVVTTTVPTASIDRTEPDPDDPAAEANRLDRFAKAFGEPPPAGGEKVDERAWPARTGRIDGDGRLRRTLNYPDPKRPTITVDYAIAEVRPDRVYLEALAPWKHRVPIPIRMVPERLLRERLERLAPADDATALLELGRFYRLAGWRDAAADALARAERAGAAADAVAAERARLDARAARRAALAKEAEADRAGPFGGPRPRGAAAKAVAALDEATRTAGRAAVDRLLAALGAADAGAIAEAREAIGGITDISVLAWEGLIHELPDRGKKVDGGGRGKLRRVGLAERRPDVSAETLARPVEYIVRWPRELPAGRRPLIVGLHGQGGPPSAALGYFSGVADRHGFVIAAPEFDVLPGEGYNHTWDEHRTAILTVRDLVRRGAPIDPDRVYVTGHSLGGHGSFDMALSHPDRFAGGMPFIGTHFAFGSKYRVHAGLVPIYVTDGEHDYDWPEKNRAAVADMIKLGGDATYAEYAGRGHEGFTEETPSIVTWMRARRRDPYPESMEWNAARPTDFQRYWVRVDVDAGRLPGAPVLNPKDHLWKIPNVKAKVARARNVIDIRTKNVRALTVLLSDGLCDLDERVTIKVNGKTRHKTTVERSLATLLDDFCERADCGQTFTATVSVEGLKK